MIGLLSTVTDYYQCYWKRLKSFGRNSTLTALRELCHEIQPNQVIAKCPLN